MTRSGFGKVAAITGAGSGLGGALALALASHGWNVAVSDINMVGAQETVDALHGVGVEAFARSVDVTRPEDFEAWAEAIQAKWGRCDLLVNNAGVAAVGEIGEVSLEDWRWCVDVDLFGVVHGCHVFVPRMKAQGSGHVVNISSVAAYAMSAHMGPYNVAKAGVVALSETLRGEVKDAGIGVTVVCPAFFRTRLAETMRSSNDKIGGIARKLVESAGMSADTVAERIVDAVIHNKPYVVEPSVAQFMFVLRRLFPAKASVAIGAMTKLAKRFG